MNINKFLDEFYPQVDENTKNIFFKTRANLLYQNNLIVVDIGAAAGLMPHWEKFKHFATIFAIEPDKRSSINLKKRYSDFSNYIIIEKAISDKTEDKILYLTNAPTGSSLLAPNLDYLYISENDDYFLPMEKKKIPTHSFLDILRDDIKDDINALKIDIQGYEYHILKNLFTKDCSSLLCVEFEAGMPGGYLEQPQFPDISKLMKENEFEVYDMRIARVHLPTSRIQTNLNDKQIIHNSPKISAKVHEIDVVYFKKLSFVLKTRNKNLIIKMMMLLNSYNFFYESTYLIEQAHKELIFSEQECKDLVSFVWDWYKILEEEPLYSDNEGANILRKFLSEFDLKNSKTWHMYMHQDYPN